MKPITIVVFAAFAAVPFLATRIDPNRYEGGRTRDEQEQIERNSSALGTILGEVRTNISDVMFIKTERYLHSGVAYMPHIDLDKTAQTGDLAVKGELKNGWDPRWVGAPPPDHEEGEEDFDFAKEAKEHQSEVDPREVAARKGNIPDTGSDSSHEGHEHGDGEHFDEHDHDHDGKSDHSAEEHGHDAHASHPHEEERQFDEHDHDHDGKPDHTAEEHEEAPTIIPTADKDYRGFIGTLEREVKPWLDPGVEHTHTSGDELLPWYRLMTLTDPTNIRAYMIGSWWLKAQKKAKYDQEALKFLNEGIVNNPKAFQLYLMRGYTQRQLGDEKGAYESFSNAGRLAFEMRPPLMRKYLMETHDTVENVKGEYLSIRRTWNDYMEDDARASARMHVISERRFGDPKKALALAREYNDKLGEPVLEGLVVETEAQLAAGK